MQGIGVREVVALGVLAFAAVIGFLFLDPAASETKNPNPGQISLGGPPPTASPSSAPEPTPAPVPAKVGQPAAGWYVSFLELRPGGATITAGQGFQQSIDFAFPGAPYLDFKDDAWALRIEGQVAAQTGANVFTLEHDGAVAVFVEGEKVAEQGDSGARQQLSVAFGHGGGNASVRIEASDNGGPFLLRWVE